MSVAEYSVRAGHCDYRASENEVYDTLCRITSPLHRSWDRLERAREIVIKLNMMWRPERIRYFEGHRQELVDNGVLRAILRLLRERTSARLVVTDTSYAPVGNRPGPELNFRPDDTLERGFRIDQLLGSLHVDAPEEDTPEDHALEDAGEAE